MAEPVLRIEDLRKNFGALAVTDGVTLDVAPGELHAVIGPNGAGKTTLINQISGFVAPESGRILFDGRDVTALPVHARARLGLARSFQITSILPGFSALENVALAVQARSGSSFRFFGRAAAEPALNQPGARGARGGRARRAASDVPAGALSHGEKRALELAIALAMAPKLILLDEPMAGTGREETDRLVALLARLKGRFAMILVEHDMTAVFALADRISVMIYGRILASGAPDDRARRSAGDRRLSRRRDGVGDGHARQSNISPPATVPPQVLFDVNLAVGEGEVVTLLGRNGMGKTTTIRALMGLLRASGGAARFAGVPLIGLPPYRIAQLGLGLVPEGRQIFPTLTVEENLIATAAARFGPPRWQLPAVYRFFPALAERRANMGNELSGGEQQMLAIGRALMTNPKLLILDEATEGLAPLHPRGNLGLPRARSSARDRRSCWSTSISMRSSGSPIATW